MNSDDMALPRALTETAHLLRQLPQIGPRHAGRLALFLFRNNEMRTELSKKLSVLNASATLCEICFRITEQSPCAMCKDETRDKGLLAVVEEDTDLEQLEATQSFNGRYFVLGGRFNPNRGGLSEQGLKTKELKDRVTKESTSLTEVILAMNPTVDGDMLALMLMRDLKETGVPLTRLGRGLPVGGEIEYADEETLKSALRHRG